MTSVGAERYREHELWKLLPSKLEAIRNARFEDVNLEGERESVIEVLEAIERSAKNPRPWIYEPILNALVAYLNGLVGGEGEFAVWVSSTDYIALKDAARQLPGPLPRDLGESYIASLDRAISLRQRALADIEARASELSANIETNAKLLTSLGESADKRFKTLATAIDGQTSKIAADAASISMSVATAADQMQAEWANALAAWELQREAKDRESDTTMATHVQLLSYSARVGQRLVEYAAGQLTAQNWATRNSRERRNAVWLRWGAIAAYLGAVAVGGILVWHTIVHEIPLDFGQGILRGAIVIALAAIGTFLITESRRHFREADSAEEVTLALQAVEPYYASSSDDKRIEARASLGDTLFIKNVLSRFAGRDASRHNSNQELSEVLDLLAKGAEAARAAGKSA